MNNDVRQIPLEKPIAITSCGERIWIADESSQSLAGFDPVSGELLSLVTLDEEPTTLTATAGLVVVGMVSSIMALDARTAQPRWQCATRSPGFVLKGYLDDIWTWYAREAEFDCIDPAGNECRFEAEGVLIFAPAPKGVYWLSSRGILWLGQGSLSPRERTSTTSPVMTGDANAMLFCANGLWIAAPEELILCHPNSLEHLAKLPIPERAVTHLICDGCRLYGGFRQVFVYDPAADAGIRVIPSSLDSPMCGIAVAKHKLWVLESDRGIVHSFDVL
jgi:hypothetical protein